jgi:hypothetical protein
LGFIHMAWPNGQCLNAMWHSLGGQCLDATWFNLGGHYLPWAFP